MLIFKFSLQGMKIVKMFTCPARHYGVIIIVNAKIKVQQAL